MLEFNVVWTKFTNSPTDLITPLSSDVVFIDMNVTVVPDWNVSVYLEWEAPVPLDPSVPTDQIEYNVYSSSSEYGPFTQISTLPTSNTTFFTNFQVADSKVYEQYFTIESVFSDGTIYRSFPQTPSERLPSFHILRYRDIIRRARILLDRFVGVDSIVYIRKRSGLRCPECWDPTHLKITNDHCEVCYGTSYEGGYDTGMKTKIQYTSVDPRSDYSYIGKQEDIAISAWTIPFPLIHPEAIILRLGDRKIFRCEGHNGSTEMLTNVQRQNFILKELGRDSVENRLFNETDFVEIFSREPHVHHGDT